MFRYTLPVAVAALALATCGAASAQVVQPQPVQLARPAPHVTDQKDLSSEDYNYYYAYKSPEIAVPIPPTAVWLPGQYKTDPGGGKAGWSKGEFVLPQHVDVGMIDGSWLEAPSRLDLSGWSSELMRFVKVIAPDA